MPALELDLDLVWNFATALLIGALVGIERERHLRAGDHPEVAGLRTFVLFALLGALSGWLGQLLQSPWILAAGLLTTAGFLLVGYALSNRTRSNGGLGQTTEIAAVSTFLLGAVAAVGEREAAVGLGVTVAALLAYKEPLHGFVEKLGSDDVYAALRLLIATFIVLPLLPDRPLDPWEALNPRSLWLLVLLISGLSLVGYVLTRLLGAHRGLALTGLTGGLVSSTAVTLAFARQGREKQYQKAVRAIAAGILLAWTVSFVRVLVEVLVVNRALLPTLWPAIAAMAVASGAFSAWLLWGGPRHGGAQAGAVELRNPFSLTQAVKFAALFAVVLLVVTVVQERAPPSGLYLVAALAGTTDVDAITLSMAEYARTGSPQVASHAITLAALSNTVVKAGMVLAIARGSLARSILPATAVILAAGVAAIVLT